MCLINLGRNVEAKEYIIESVKPLIQLRLKNKINSNVGIFIKEMQSMAKNIPQNIKSRKKILMV